MRRNICNEADSDRCRIKRARQDPKPFGTAYDRHVARVYAYVAFRVGRTMHDPEPGSLLERQWQRQAGLGEVERMKLVPASLVPFLGPAVAVLLTACAVTLTRPASTPTQGPGVANVLAHPSGAGGSAELDAYFSGAGAPSMPGDASASGNLACPNLWTAALTDRPFPPYLFILNGSHSNSLPEDAPWLIAIAADATHTDAASGLQLPYHGRFRGHFDEPAFARCAHADRIFVIDAVVTTYQALPSGPSAYPMQLPEGFTDWPRYHDDRFGYSLPHPRDWVVAPLTESNVLEAVSFRTSRYPDDPIVVRVHDAETHYDQYDPRSAPPLLETGVGGGFGVFQQGMPFRGEIATAGLAGYEVDRQLSPTAREVAVLFSACGRTYAVAMRYPLGFDAHQSLLTTYSAIVEGFRLDAPQGPTPTPPVKQFLGTGPFLSQDQVLARAQEHDVAVLQLIDARLVPEAEARRVLGPCGSFQSHPDGVWVLTVRGTFEREIRTMRLILDATTGEQLCSEEVSPDAIPEPPQQRGITPVAPVYQPTQPSQIRGTGLHLDDLPKVVAITVLTYLKTAQETVSNPMEVKPLSRRTISPG